jgi:hypothetical protein
LILSLFEGILVIFGGSWALLRPDLEGKLGVCYPLQVYINQRFLRPRGGSEQKNDEELKSQIHFYVRKLLRRATLQAIYGSFIHPFSLSLVLMGS